MEPVKLRSARDGHDPRLLAQAAKRAQFAPASRPFGGNALEQVNDCHVGGARIVHEARRDIAEVPGVELRRVDLARQEARAQGAEGHESDGELLACFEHAVALRVSRPDRVFALHGGHRVNRVGTANRRGAGFREPEVLHFPFTDEVLDCPRHVFDSDGRVDTVLIEDVDHVHLQTASAQPR